MCTTKTAINLYIVRPNNTNGLGHHCFKYYSLFVCHQAQVLISHSADFFAAKYRWHSNRNKIILFPFQVNATDILRRIKYQFYTFLCFSSQIHIFSFSCFCFLYVHINLLSIAIDSPRIPPTHPLTHTHTFSNSHLHPAHTQTYYVMSVLWILSVVLSLTDWS